MPEKNSELKLPCGLTRLAAKRMRLPLTQATDGMLSYNRRYPAALRTLAGILGYRSDGSEDDVRVLAGGI
jgi:hypothetical protein